MPLYEYRCESCDYSFENLERSAHPPRQDDAGTAARGATACPRCGTRATRVFSTFAPRGDRSVSSTQGVCRHAYGCSCAKK